MYTNKNFQGLLSFIVLLILIAGCQPKVNVIDDLNDKSFQLINQEGESILFPDDYAGKYVVMGFIYTKCPDICPLVTQNMIKVQKDLGNPEDVQFLGISFDPKRDTPEVLKDYKALFNLEDNFDFLTADTTTISEFMDSVRVRSQVSFSTINEYGEELYFLNHSDKIMVVDPKGRVVLEYGGSMTPKEYIIEDLNQIRKN